MRNEQRHALNDTVKDSLELGGIAILLYLMFDSVALHQEPQWAVFWLSLAALGAWLIFYNRCIDVVRQLIDSGRDWISTHGTLGRR